MNKIAAAVLETKGDVDKAVELLVKQKQVDANDMANRVANTSIVYSYVHNNKVGAMIVLACQTDFVAKNESFLNLAKNICMHIVSTPVEPGWVSEETVPLDTKEGWRSEFNREFADGKKPPQVVSKIVDGKMKKRVSEWCLENQTFVREDGVTIGQLIKDVSATVGEKIEVKHFVKVIAK